MHPDFIFDRNGRPELTDTVNEGSGHLPPTCILIGEAMADYANLSDDFYDRAYADLHIWKEEIGLSGAKEIAGAVRTALPTGAWLVPGFRAPHVTLASARFIRDPGNRFAHGILTVEATLMRIAP